MALSIKSPDGKQYAGESPASEPAKIVPGKKYLITVPVETVPVIDGFEVTLRAGMQNLIFGEKLMKLRGVDYTIVG